MKGFALLISVLFLLLLTLFGFCMLLVASNYYSASHVLLHKENARLACEGATLQMVLRHNSGTDTPRFFFNSSNWNGTSLQQYNWNGYSVNGSIAAPWSATAPNLFLISTRRGSFVAQQYVQIRQLRFEDFALFADVSQSFVTAPLFDGRVFARDTITLENAAGAVFRDYVHSTVQPEFSATFRKRSLERLQFPSLTSFVSMDTIKQSLGADAIYVTAHNPVFWIGNQYDLDLDEIQLQQQKSGWKILYKGIELGVSRNLAIWFDDLVAVHQQNWPPPLTDSAKPRVPFYIFSDRKVIVHSNLNPFESAAAIHPPALVSAGAMTIASDVPLGCRLDALLLALGFDGADGAGLVIEAGGSLLTETEKTRFASEISLSSFLVEDKKRSELLIDLNANRKIIWFRGSVVLAGRLKTSDDLTQLHFESSHDVFSLFPSFPFVYQVEGSRQWQ